MHSPAAFPPASSSVNPAYAIFAGLCASLVGIGLARFAYTPLIPSLIDAHWFAATDVIYLGAANLVGYLAGALAGRPLARRVHSRHVLRWMMLLASLAFMACAVPLSMAWFFGWRFVSGVAGGVIMVLAASSVLPHVPAERRGLASGAIFLGLGLGIAASGTLVPLLLHYGLRQAWIGLGVVGLVLTAASWHGWPAVAAQAAPAGATGSAQRAAGEGAASRPMPLELKLIYLQYALMAVGLVPMMVFLVDFVSRGLGWGTHMAALFWVVYGLGAIAGPMVYGALADRIGNGHTARIALAAQVLAVAGLVLAEHPVAAFAATFVIGSFPPGIVPIVLGRVHSVLPGDVPAQQAAWSRATTVFALFQALAGYAYSYVFAQSQGSHRLIFAIAGVALAVALAAEAVLLWRGDAGGRKPATARAAG